MARAFAGGTTQQGWRIVFVDSRVRSAFAVVVEDALNVVGFEDGEPCWRPATEPDAPQPTDADGSVGLLARFGRTVEPPPGEGAFDREASVASAAAALIALRPRLPVFLGPAGAGKSYLLGLLAARLPTIVPETTVVDVDLGCLFMGTLLDSERENLLTVLLGEAGGSPSVVLALERIDLVRTETRHGTAALAAAVKGGTRIVAMLAAASLTMFDDTPLEPHLHPVPVKPPSVTETCGVVRAESHRISAHHGVRIDDELVRPIVERAASLAGALPATALALADLACARARIEGRGEVGIAHIYVAACSFQKHDER